MGSLTLGNKPFNFQPANNPLIYTMRYSDITEAGFKFNTKLKVNNSDIKTLKKQSTKGNYQEFDVSTIVENYLYHTFNPSIKTPTISVGSTATVYFSGGYQTDTASGWTGYSPVIVFNGAMDRNEWIDYSATSATTYYMNPLYKKEFLTDYKERTVELTDEGTVSAIYYNGFSNWDYVSVTPYSSSTPNTTYYFKRNTSTTGIQDIPIYPANLNDLSGTVTGITTNGMVTTNFVLSGDMITSNVYKYVVRLVRYGLVEASETLTFNINNICTQYDNIQIAWLNKLGVFDYITFDLKTRTSKKIEYDTYTKSKGVLTNYDWTYSKRDFEITKYKSNNNKIYTLSSNWVNDTDSQRIVEMTEASVVYIKYNNEWIGVNVEVEQIEELTQQNDMLFNFTIVASANYNNRRHRL